MGTCLLSRRPGRVPTTNIDLVDPTFTGSACQAPAANR